MNEKNIYNKYIEQIIYDRIVAMTKLIINNDIHYRNIYDYLGINNISCSCETHESSVRRREIKQADNPQYSFYPVSDLLLLGGHK